MKAGVSGLALYVPRPRVRLEDFCEWTGQPWPKISKVVGDSFRVCAAHESVYTMAANAVLRLIEQYDIDPRQVGLLALGTESSTDNSAGAVIVRGMVDDALSKLGRPRIATDCEVPEMKHACLGGMYALKSALRYVATDGKDRVSIIVSADIAEYERGSTGEPTQGAGAVAMLVEAQPKLVTIDLSGAGSASTYRGVDFRKPVARYFVDGYADNVQRLHDFPVFNGRYSTQCYMRTVGDAIESMFRRQGTVLFDDAAAVVMHRPYAHMPVQALSMVGVRRLAWTEAGRRALVELARTAEVDPEGVIAELTGDRDLFEMALADGVDAEPYPLTAKVVKTYRSSAAFKTLVEEKMKLGEGMMRHLGNLYTGALPAWLGAAFEEALTNDVALEGRTILAVGYGSGDAAEAWPLVVTDGWREAATRLRFAAALEGAVDLDRAAYEAAHDGKASVDIEPTREFAVERIGDRVDPSFQDVGIEYYRFVA